MAGRRHVRGGRVRAATAAALLVLLLIGVSPVLAGADLFHRGILALLQYRISGDVASYDFTLDSLVPLSASEAAAFGNKMTAEDTMEIHISTAIHGSDGWFLVRTSEPTLCFVVEDAVHTCVYGLGQRYGASCTEQSVGDRQYVLACKVTVLTGTGIYGSGTAYFATRPPFSFLGYLPGYEYLSSNWYTAGEIGHEDQIGTLSWNAEDRSDPETPRYIDRCIVIKFTPLDVKGQLVRSEERCEAYRIDMDAGRIVHLRGLDSSGAMLMNVYEDVSKSVAGVK